MEAIKGFLKKYWWIILIIIALIIWYYSSQETEQKKQEEKKKFLGGGTSECEEISISQWNAERTAILAWLDFQPQSKRDEIACIYWEKSGDTWTDVSYRFAEDELLRKGYCKPK